MPDNIVPKKGRKILVLSLTDQCNLKCVYCYEHNRVKKFMTSDVAKNAIMESFEERDYDELEINFFGGEPFIAFSKIREIAEWLWGLEAPKPYVLFASTNGTLIGGDIREWVIKNHKRFILGLSVDGTPEMHNKNRSNSFSKIDLALFKELWPFQTVKMTVSRETLSSLAEGVIYLTEIGFKVNCNNAYGIEWQNEDELVFTRELRKLADYYLDNPSIEPSSIIAMPIEHLKENIPPQKYCGAGTHILCLDPFGNKYPCQAFMPCAAGQDIEIETVFSKLRGDIPSDDRCTGCPIIFVCSTCYGLNFSRYQDLFTRDQSYCGLQKVRAKAAAYLVSQMLVNRDRNFAYIRNWSDSHVYRAIRGINAISQNF